MASLNMSSGGLAVPSFGNCARTQRCRQLSPYKRFERIQLRGSSNLGFTSFYSLYNSRGGAIPAAGGGNGGNNNNGHWDDCEGGEDGDGGGFDLRSFIFGLLVLATPSYLVWKRYQKKMEYDSDPIAILKRLVGELFETDIELRNRLSKVEGRLGIVSSESPAGNASKVDIGDKESKSRSATGMGMLKSLGGRLVMGGGFLWGNEDETTLDSIVETGTQLGTTMTLQARGKFRDGKDFVLADIEVDGAESEKFCLRKVVYSCGLASSLRLMFAPFGARGNDVTYTLNPFSGRGLIAGNSEGNPLLYNRGTGSALAATLSLPRAWLTAAFFGSENEETTEKVMAQAVFAPLKALSLGFTVSDPTASNGKLKEYADSLMRFVSKAPQARTQDTTSDKTVSDLEIATSFALSLGKYACHGWASTNTSGTLFSNDVAWNVVLGDKGTEPGQELRWILSAGKTFKSDTTTNPPINNLKPDTFEVSTDIDLGNGLHCQPGVLAIKQQSSWVFLAGAKTVWDF